jgi:hypothetical protein
MAEFTKKRLLDARAHRSVDRSDYDDALDMLEKMAAALEGVRQMGRNDMHEVIGECCALLATWEGKENERLEKEIEKMRGSKS